MGLSGSICSVDFSASSFLDVNSSIKVISRYRNLWFLWFTVGFIEELQSVASRESAPYMHSDVLYRVHHHSGTGSVSKAVGWSLNSSAAGNNYL